MVGLAAVIIDALTRREWVQEDYVPQAIDGAPDLRVNMPRNRGLSSLTHHAGRATGFVVTSCMSPGQPHAVPDGGS